MNYWFFIGNDCLKFGRGKGYRFFFCDSVPLSRFYMHQFIPMNGLLGVTKFEDCFSNKPNGAYNFTCEGITIHVVKKMKKITVYRIDYDSEAEPLEEFLMERKTSLGSLINLPMMVSWQSYLIGGIIGMAVIVLVIKTYGLNLRPVDMEKKYQILNEISSGSNSSV